MIFSIPINPKLNENQFNIFYNFCKSYKSHIYDLYFTCRMPPFLQDAMGDVIQNDPYGPIENALNIQETLGIPVSATFNNIMIRPDQDNLDLFISNFSQLYDAGIRSATIPHTQWLLTGQIQKQFPELMIKNTILRNVNRANQVAKLAEAGFHYVNIDRDLMRDLDELKRIKKVSEKYSIKIALLANEGCLGNCPIMDEHYHFNNTRSLHPQYFDDPISRISCQSWKLTDLSTELKNAILPPWRDDWVEILNYVDVFKMHGRENIQVLYRTMELVGRYVSNQKILYDDFETYLIENNLEENPINLWRQKIKNCKFDCWDCNYCDKVYEKKSKIKTHQKVIKTIDAIDVSAHNNISYDRLGLTSLRVQNLMHELSKFSNNFLEIGSGFGSVTQTVHENVINLHCVDNWSDSDIQSQEMRFELSKNNIDEFKKNVKRDVIIHECDILSVDKTNIKDIDLFFYDGPKEEEYVFLVIDYYKDCFDDVCVMVFDDANWSGIVEGALNGILKNNFKILYDKKILNPVEDLTKWWNGLYIIIIEKNETI